MHNCDQGVSNFTMGDSLGYFAADVVETLGVLSRRLLAHWDLSVIFLLPDELSLA